MTGQHRATQRHEPAAETAQDPDAGLRAWLRRYAKTIRGVGFGPLITMPALKVGKSITRRCNGSGVRKLARAAAAAP
ncbi:integrase, catalytic region domain protein [Mycobacterium kansasii 662]|uniref:Integrase, catalytic region domain protein n=1 Tax=Mycobacterium kansasii 662 TaxID=1299326 RepID=X7Y3P8_MYCKA|nr:integrase, catalytic region domain protein [Mycobacterium kansasii 662]